MSRLVLLLALACAAPASAQPFTVVASQPVDYTAGVPLETTVSFTFSAPVADFTVGPPSGAPPPTVVFLPVDSVTVAAPTLSADGRTVSYDVQLRPETRYVALVLDARSAGGGALARPFALNFTTAPSSGPLTVRGTVTHEDGGSLDGTLVALVTGDLTTGAVALVAVEVLDAAGSTQVYALGPVPLGLYTVGALRLPLHGAAPLYGFYDANGDGTPDPVIIPFGVNVTVGGPAPITAGAYYGAAVAAAGGVVQDPYLKSIPAREVGTDGAAPFWIYLFASPATPDDAAVFQIGFLSIPVAAPDDVLNEPALADPFVDTDAALATAQDAGGADFLADHAAEVVTVTASGNDGSPGDPIPVPFWLVHYEARDGLGGPVVASFGAFIDMATGALIGTATAAEPPPAPSEGPRLVVSPNPLDGRATVAYALDQPGRARLAVYDLLGREVAVLVDGPRESGRHEAVLEASALPAGTYLLRLAAGGTVAARTVTLLR